MLVVPGLPSYNGVEVYYLKGVIGLPIVISFRDRWYTHIFFLEMGSLMTSSSSAGPIQISKFGKRKVQGVPQSQTAALPRPQEEEETDKSKQAQTEQTYEKH